MKKIVVIGLLAIVLISLNSCKKVIGDGPVVAETRITREYAELDFGVPGELVFIESDENEIRIEAQQNIIDVIETYVSGDELKIRVRDNRNISTSEPIRITIKAPSVRSLAVSGSGSLHVPGSFSPVHGRLRVSGSGKITVNKIETEDLETRISGSGNIGVLEGTAGHEGITISGSGDVDLLPVIAHTVNTQTSGSGNIRIHVTDELEVKISGSGDVYYKGSPAVNVSISGSGKIVKL